MLYNLVFYFQLILRFLGVNISKLLVVENFLVKLMFSNTFHVEEKLKFINGFELNCSPRVVNRRLAIYYILLLSNKLYKMISYPV